MKQKAHSRRWFVFVFAAASTLHVTAAGWAQEKKMHRIVFEVSTEGEAQ